VKKIIFLLILTVLVSPAPSTLATPALANGSYSLFLPVIPNRLIYDPVVEGYIHQVNYDRIYGYTYDMVIYQSPRHHDWYNIYKYPYQNCTIKNGTNKKNNLIVALENAVNDFQGLGYQTSVEAIPENYGGGYNIIVHKPASAPYPVNTIIDIGAHIDADKDWEGQTPVSTPGAVDNAVSVAALLEMAAILKDYPNVHPWQFIVFVAEEHGRHGSKQHAQIMVSQPFKGALVMDGIGWSELEPDYMNCSWADDNIPYSVIMAELFDLTRRAYQIPIQWRRCSDDYQVSDNVSYFEVNLPAVLSIGGMPFTDPNNHSLNNNCAADSMENIDWTNTLYTIQENIGVLLEMDKEP
jgi:hypothetical protein